MKIIKDLTKDYLFDKIGQENIFKAFLGEEVDLDKKYFSPFRTNDKDPSCSFYYRNGKLRFKDFGGDFNGDCLDLIAYQLRMNVRHKHDFMFILHTIASYFGLFGYQKTFNIIKTSQNLISTKKEITFVVTTFDFVDKNYWKDYGIDIKDLNSQYVYRVKLAWIDNTLIYSYNKANPCYLYLFSRQDFRLYFPKSINKFITTSNCSQGLNLLEPADFIIITKSMKDALVLRTYLVKGKHIQSFALGSEGSLLSEKGYNWLTEVMGYKYIFTLFDYDRQGLTCTIKHRRKYNTIPLFIKLPTWNSGLKYDVKDISDYRKHYGKEKTQKLIEDTYERISIFNKRQPQDYKI